jgi:hypothetical protein
MSALLRSDRLLSEMAGARAELNEVRDLFFPRFPRSATFRAVLQGSPISQPEFWRAIVGNNARAYLDLRSANNFYQSRSESEITLRKKEASIY